MAKFKEKKKKHRNTCLIPFLIYIEGTTWPVGPPESTVLQHSYILFFFSETQALNGSLQTPPSLNAL